MTIEAQSLKNNASSNDTEIGGLSAESIDIAKANTSSDLTVNATDNSTDFGGLSSKSVNSTN